MQIFFLIIIIFTLAIALCYAINNRVKMIYFFLFMVMFQNIIAIIFCKYIPPLYNTIFSIIKEVMLYIALILYTVKNGKIKINKKNQLNIIFLSIYILTLFKNLIDTPAGVSSSILSLRYMLVPILCIYVGKNIYINSNECKVFLRRLIAFSIILSILGLIEMYILGDSFWVKIGYSTYAVKMKGSYTHNLFRGVTVNFYTWDFFGKPLRRMVSITADPLATAFLVYLGALIILTGGISLKNRNGKLNGSFVALIFLIISSILSLSKAIFVLIALTILICAYFYKWLPKGLLRIATAIFLVFFAYTMKSYVSNTDVTTSSLNHITGLLNGFSTSGWLGNGLGTAGSSVIMLTGTESDVSESYIGALFSQVGMVGGVSFIMFLLMQIGQLVKLYKIYKSQFVILALVCLIGIMVCMIFSDSAVSIMGTGIYFIIIGMAQQIQLYQDKRNVE